MRSKAVLFQLDDIPILLQYLYMNEDHHVVINNGLEGCLDVIYMLKHMPATEFPERFQSRWDEIKEITLANLALNKEWK